MIRPLIRTTAFDRALRRTTRGDKAAAAAIAETLARLEADAFDPRLRTHKLTGNLAAYWACSAGYDLRIIFRFVQVDGSECILLVSGGTHDDVY